MTHEALGSGNDSKLGIAEVDLIRRCYAEARFSSHEPQSPTAIRALCLSSDDRYLAASIGDLSTLVVTAVWRVDSEQLLGVYEGLAGEILSDTDLLELTTLVDGGAVRTKVRRRFVSIEQERDVKRLKGYSSHRKPGRWMQSWTGTGKIKFWDHRFNNSEVRLQGAKSLQRVAVSSDGHPVATRSYGGIITLWDGESGEKKLELHHEFDGMSRSSLSFAFLPNKPRLWSIHGNRIVVWNTTTGDRLKVIETAEDLGGIPYPSPDGRFLVIDPLLKDLDLPVCDLELGQVTHWIRFRPKRTVYFSPDSKTGYCVGSEGCIRVHMKGGAREVIRADAHWVGAVNQNLLALGSNQGEILCHDHRSMEVVQRFQFPQV